MASPAAQAVAKVVLDFSFNAGSDCSSAATGGHGPNGSFQYSIVKMTANDLEIAPSSSIRDIAAIGVLQNAPVANQAATVRLLGLTKLVVDGSAVPITPGMTLGSDGAGRGTSSSSAVPYVAIALQNSTAANDIITAMVVQASY